MATTAIRAQTASELDRMSVDDICEHSQVAIDAARARTRLAKSARHDPALRDTLIQCTAIHNLFADVIEGDLRRRRVRARADGSRSASPEEMAEYRGPRRGGTGGCRPGDHRALHGLAEGPGAAWYAEFRGACRNRDQLRWLTLVDLGPTLPTAIRRRPVRSSASR